MAVNQHVNKVILNGTTLMDVSDNTITDEDMMEGVTATMPDGSVKSGKMRLDDIETKIDTLLASGGGGASGSFVRLDDITFIGKVEGPIGAGFKWSDPGDVYIQGGWFAEWEGTLLVRKYGETPSSPTDGTVVLDNKIRNQYQSEYFYDQTGEYGVYYYYRFFPYTKSGIYTNGYSTTNKKKIIPFSDSSTTEEIQLAIDASHEGLLDLYEDMGWRVGDTYTTNVRSYSYGGSGGTNSFFWNGTNLIIPKENGETYTVSGVKQKFWFGYRDETTYVKMILVDKDPARRYLHTPHKKKDGNYRTHPQFTVSFDHILIPAEYYSGSLNVFAGVNGSLLFDRGLNGNVTDTSTPTIRYSILHNFFASVLGNSAIKTKGHVFNFNDYAKGGYAGWSFIELKDANDVMLLDKYSHYGKYDIPYFSEIWSSSNGDVNANNQSMCSSAEGTRYARISSYQNIVFLEKPSDFNSKTWDIFNNSANRDLFTTTDSQWKGGYALTKGVTGVNYANTNPDTTNITFTNQYSNSNSQDWTSLITRVKSNSSLTPRTWYRENSNYVVYQPNNHINVIPCAFI